jgi:hypothetical protein
MSLGGRCRTARRPSTASPLVNPHGVRSGCLMSGGRRWVEYIDDLVTLRSIRCSAARRPESSKAAPLGNPLRSPVVGGGRKANVGDPKVADGPIREQTNGMRRQASTPTSREQPIADGTARLVGLAEVEPDQAQAGPVELADRERRRAMGPPQLVPDEDVLRGGLGWPDPADNIGIMDASFDGRQIPELRGPQHHLATRERGNGDGRMGFRRYCRARAVIVAHRERRSRAGAGRRPRTARTPRAPRMTTIAVRAEGATRTNRL